MGKERYQSLDSLRGIAALSVVNMHVLGLWPWFWSQSSSAGITLENVFKFTPISILFDGREAVIFFFILSGFVLSLGSSKGYGVFMGKRVLRLYVPFLISLVFSVVLRLLAPLPRPGLSDWIYNQWVNGVSVHSVLQNLLLVYPYNTDGINPVYWSLSIEMRVSLLFPLLVYLVGRMGTQGVLRLIGVLLATNFVVDMYHASRYLDNFPDTLGYTAIFLVGILLQRHRQLLSQPVPNWARFSLLAVGLFLFSFKWLLLPPSAIVDSPVTNTLAVAAGAAMVMVWALKGGGSRFLGWSPVVYLGQVSYSLYLVHFPLLLLLVSWLHPMLPTTLIASLVYVLAFSAASVFHRYIEIPSIQAARDFKGIRHLLYKMV